MEMTAQERERLPEERRGWIPPVFTALEEREAREGREEGSPPIRRVPLPGGLAQALERYGAVVLLGEPGVGKTTTLAHLAGQLASDPDLTRIPILVPLRRYGRDDAPLDFIRRNWALALQDDLNEAIRCGEAEPVPLHGVGEAVRPLAALLDHLLEWGQLVLLLDGLNEMPGLAPNDPRLARLAAFVDRARSYGNRVAVACRVLDYADLRRPLERPLQRVELEPLDEGRIRTFLRGYLGDEEEERLACWLGEPERRAIRELCRVPFFLALVTSLYVLKKGEPPTSRVELLDEYIERTVRREQKQRWEPELLVRPLSEMALVLQERGKLEMWQSEARSYLEAFPKGGADNALRLAEGAGLLRMVLTSDLRGARLRFVHQLWQQDLAARALVRQVRGDGAALFKALQPHLFDERWVDVVALAGARLKDATPLLERLLAANANDVWRQRPLFLAAAALAEGARAGQKVRRQVVDGLEDRIRAPWWRESVSDAIAALRRLGEEEYATQRLRTLARDKEVDTQVRVEAAQALGELGRAEELLALSWGEGLDAYVRMEVAEALGKLGQARKAAEILLSLALDKEVEVLARLEATEALKRLGQTKELLALARDWRARVRVRKEAAEALEKLGQVEEAGEAWLALAQDEDVDAYARMKAAEALHRLGQVTEAARALLKLVQDKGVGVYMRVRAAETLGRLGQPVEATEAWRTLVQEMEAWVREEAAGVLGKLGRTKEAAEAWLGLARDKKADVQVRWRAVMALWRLGRAAITSEVLKGLRALAEDPSTPEEVRRAARKALRQLESRQG